MEARIKPDIRISGQGVVFDPSTGESYTVNGTGREILSLMAEGLGRDDIFRKMSSVYQLSWAEFERNYLDFIMVLKSWQLLEHES